MTGDGYYQPLYILPFDHRGSFQTRRGHLDVPIIGVAKAGWGVDELRARARDSVTEHGGLDAAAFGTLCGLLRYVDGDYRDPKQ